MKIVFKCWVIIALSASGLFAQGYESIALWPDGAPGAKADGGEEIVKIYESTGDHLVSNVHCPSITPFVPPKEASTGIAVILAPGGAHREIWIDHEGYTISKKLNEQGIAAFVLKYRLAEEENSTYTVENHSVKDMLRAIRVVRSRADEWHINPQAIGVMGFSAGGEIAALSDMSSDNGLADAGDPALQISSKPDFQALIYPYHSGIYVPTAQSAPAFIVCGFHDDLDRISTRMPELYLKFKELNIPTELHIYANAGHGFGVRQGDTGASSKWLDAFVAWLGDLQKNSQD